MNQKEFIDQYHVKRNNVRDCLDRDDGEMADFLRIGVAVHILDFLADSGCLDPCVRDVVVSASMLMRD